MIPIPPLDTCVSTSRLLIRPPCMPHDFDSFAAMLTHPLVCLHDDLDPSAPKGDLLDEFTTYCIEDPVQDTIGGVNPDYHMMVIQLKSDVSSTMLGALYLVNYDEDVSSIELGYQLHPDHWGKGYASEAVKGMILRLFDEGIHRIECRVDPLNKESFKLLGRLGFKVEGTLRHVCKVRGELRDETVASLLSSDTIPS